jgi:hypothetical protein
MVSVLAIKVRVFKPGRMRSIFKGDKNPQHDFYRWGSKAVDQSRKFLRHVTGPLTVSTKILRKAKDIISYFTTLLLDDSW